MNYTGQINWGDWQQMPDYRAGMVNKNKSAIAGIIPYLDPHSSLGYMPVFKDQQIFRDGTQFFAEGQDKVWTTANQVLEPVMKVSSVIGKYTDPVQGSLSKTLPDQHKGLTDWISTHGADVAAIVAATYFTGGAASSALGGAGAAAAPAASGGAGAAGGLAGSAGAASAAITPAFASGAAGGAGVTAGAGAGGITPAFGAAGLSIAPEAASGGLGAAGTAAANALLTPAFASWGGGGAGLLGSLKGVASKANQIDNYRSNIQKFANADTTPTERQIYNQQAGDLAGRIINSTLQPAITPRQKVAQQMTINRMGRRW